nr:MAG TPA: hypothetical protein [Caudoviricetes sp.]
MLSLIIIVAATQHCTHNKQRHFYAQCCQHSGNERVNIHRYHLRLFSPS